MHRFLRISLFVSLPLLAACGRGPLADDFGAGSLPPTTDDDAAVVLDAVDPPETSPGIDAPDPPPPFDDRLGNALACHMDREAAVEAIVRYVSCDRGRGATVGGLIELWEAGLFSNLEPSGGLGEGLPGDHGCDSWRCIRSAKSCGDVRGCLAANDGVRCMPGQTACNGSAIATCAPEGTGHVRGFDCGLLGATCEKGRCRLGACTFGAEYYQLKCVGNAISVCDGAVQTPCDRFAPGSKCSPFYIGGEVPTTWCSPTGKGEAGGYARPVECARGTLTFTSVSKTKYTFDCLAHGYARCSENGCEAR